MVSEKSAVIARKMCLHTCLSCDLATAMSRILNAQVDIVGEHFRRKMIISLNLLDTTFSNVPEEQNSSIWNNTR